MYFILLFSRNVANNSLRSIANAAFANNVQLKQM